MRKLSEVERAAILARLANKDSFDDIARDFGMKRVDISKFSFMALWNGELIIS